MGWEKHQFLLLLSSSLVLTSTMMNNTINCAAATTAISPFCANSEEQHRALCTDLVKGAKTWRQAMMNALDGAIGSARMAKPRVIDRLPQLLLPCQLDTRSRESLNSTCVKYFNSQLSTLHRCAGLVTKNEAEYAYENSALHSCLSAPLFSFCMDALDGRGVSVPSLTRLGDQIWGLQSILLSIFSMSFKSPAHLL